MLKVYQLYQLTTGFKFRIYLESSMEKAIDNWVTDFWQKKSIFFTRKEAEELFEELVGDNLEKLGCHEYNIEEFIQTNLLKLGNLQFAVYSDIKHQGSFKREYVIEVHMNKYFKEIYNFIRKEYGEDCVGYIDELLHTGYDKNIYKYLNGLYLDDLYVGANYEFYGFYPIPAKTWFKWYEYAREEIIDTRDSFKGNFLFYDERDRFIDYPFPGYDMSSEILKKNSQKFSDI